MTKKIKEPKEILVIFEEIDEGIIEKNCLCPTCLNEVKNKDQVCKYCNEELKEKK